MSGKPYRQVVHFPFGDADMARILYFPRVFHYCHIVMEGLIQEATGKSYQHLLDERKLGFPTAHTEADYHAPLPYGRDLTFEMSIRRMGTSSLDFGWSVRMEGEDQVRTEIRSTVVCVNMDRFESVPIPDDLRRDLSAFLVP